MSSKNLKTLVHVKETSVNRLVSCGTADADNVVAIEIVGNKDHRCGKEIRFDLELGVSTLAALCDDLADTIKNMHLTSVAKISTELLSAADLGNKEFDQTIKSIIRMLDQAYSAVLLKAGGQKNPVFSLAMRACDCIKTAQKELAAFTTKQ